jgi:hypothetical protein
MRRHQIAGAAFLALALGACSKSKDNTELVVTVWSDLTVPGEMDALRIRVTGSEQTIDHPFRLSSSPQPGTYQIPVQLGLVPAGNKDLSISVAAVGSYQGTDIVSQEALLPFIPDQARELVLYLGRSCKNIFCADHPGYTCENGACTKLITTDTAALPTYVPGRPSGSPDAGPTPSGAGGIAIGSGGVKGTGGMVGGGGVKGTGGVSSAGGTTGSSGADGTLCPLPNRALITDFTDAPSTSSDPTQPRFAISGGLQGGLILYPTSGSYPLTASVAENNWHIAGTVGDYSGIALYFDNCDRLDASKYKGLSFTISGALQDNSIVLGIESSANKPSAAWLISKGDTKAKEGDSGRCTPTSGDGPYFHPGCTAATMRLSPSSSPTVQRVYWSDLTGGEPDSSPKPTEITSIYWLFPWSAGSPPYALDITLDDLKFIEEGPSTSTGGSGGGGAGGTAGNGGTAGKNILDLVPLDNGVSGWRVDRTGNPSGTGQPMTATTEQEAVALIDGGAEAFYMAPYTPRVFAWQNYVNSTLPAAPDGARLRLYVLQMPSADQAAGLYTAVLQLAEYSRKSGTPDDWQPTSPPVGAESRIQDTATSWWVNFHQDVFYVEVNLDPSYGPAPDYTPGNASTKAEAIRFAQAVAAAIGPAPGGAGGTGGSKADGGSAGTGGGGGTSCSNATPCGGDVVGTWAVTSSCLNVAGQLDMSIVGVGCTSAPVTGVIQVTGTWSAKSDGTYSDSTTTSGSEQIALPASCLQISGTTATCDQIGRVLAASFGYDSVSCTSAAGGGCTCSATVRQTGGIGFSSSDPSTSGRYTTSGSVVTLDGGPKYSYCVSGNQMTWSPQSTSPTLSGTVVFQK